jgi:hypothetical protein
MTDAELQSLAAAFKGVIEEQAVTFRAQLTDLRADLDLERAKNAEYRRLESQSQQRMYAQLADAVGDAVRPSIQDLRQRTAVLEQRSMPTEITQ